MPGNAYQRWTGTKDGEKIGFELVRSYGDDPRTGELTRAWLGHMVQTSNHWSNIPTSYAILDRVIVPHLLKVKRELGLAADHPSIFLVDMWYGWCKQDKAKKYEAFPGYVKKHYPWLRLVFVPAACTSTTPYVHRPGAARRSGHDLVAQGADAPLLLGALYEVRPREAACRRDCRGDQDRRDRRPDEDAAGHVVCPGAVGAACREGAHVLGGAREGVPERQHRPRDAAVGGQGQPRPALPEWREGAMPEPTETEAEAQANAEAEAEEGGVHEADMDEPEGAEPTAEEYNAFFDAIMAMP